MVLRYLVGPVNPVRARQWQAHRDQHRCLTFHPSEGADLTLEPVDSWDALLSRMPRAWRPDFIALDLDSGAVPAWLWNAPIPLVGLVADPARSWHFMRRFLPLCQVVLSDAASVEAMHKAGITNAWQTNLFGPHNADSKPAALLPDRHCDIDVLFSGNLHPALQLPHLHWMGRLARVAGKWRVHITQDVNDEEYRQLVQRSRISFIHSTFAASNLRVADASAGGALLFIPVGNRELLPAWKHGEDCVFYDEGNLESLLEHYLQHEEERRTVAESGRCKLQSCTFQATWDEVLDQIEQHWPEIEHRHQSRPCLDKRDILTARTWQMLRTTDGGDPTLAAGLDAEIAVQPDAVLYNCRALVEALRARDVRGRYSREGLRSVAAYFHRSATHSSTGLVASLNVIEALAVLGQKQMAVEGAKRLLGRLLEDAPLFADLDQPHFPPAHDFFSVEWDRAAWQYTGSPTREIQAKRALLHWRLHALLGEWTGELLHLHEAALARPDLPSARGALGCALGGAKRPEEAVSHLRFAVESDPFDRSAARALFQALIDAGKTIVADTVKDERLLLHMAAPTVLPAEDWFMQPRRGQGQTAADGPLSLLWEGAFLAQHSLGLVNRELCRGLIQRGHELSLLPIASPGAQIEPSPTRELMGARLGKVLSRPEDVCIRLGWPPCWQPPAHGHWVVFQPWEFGSIPRDWVRPLTELVDEVWVPSSFVRDGFVRSGVSADRVIVVPHGIDQNLYRPGVEPLPLNTRKRFKFLFVGGTIHRKGIDVLLRAYGRSFRRGDDVCLVIKDMGVGSFYKGQTAEGLIDAFRAVADNPEILYLNESLTDEEMARLYCACDCLVQPYRGEGFGLPILEAMACGLPVLVTGYGAALDFCCPDTALLLPAREVRLPERHAGGLDTVDFPWLAEPDEEALVGLLRQAFEQPRRGHQRATAALQRVRDRFLWEHAVAQVEERLFALRRRPIRRLHVPPVAMVHGHRMHLHEPAADRWVSAPLLAGVPYEPFETNLLLSQVRPGDAVLDLGANVGYYTLLLARRVGPAGKVFAFEPDPANFELLQRNVDQSGYANVTLVGKAASDHNGTAQLFRSADNQGDHRLYPSTENRPAVTVETVRLDDFFADQNMRLDLVKMDIQGSEGIALSGMQQLLTRSPDVKLFCEFWPLGLRRAGGSAEAMLRLLEEQSFLFHEISEPRRIAARTDAGTLLRRYPELEESFTNLFCTREAADQPIIVGRKKVSACIIVKNEETNLHACLDSLAGLDVEIVVLDTGSTDRTREIARERGAKVFEFPWVDSFSAARNACLAHATGEWIFWLDADDRIDEENRAKLHKLFSSLPAENVAFSMKCRCLPDPITGSATTVDHMRLFLNHPRIRWRYRVHEQILGAIREAGGEVRWTDIVIEHTGYTDPPLRRRKLQRDLRLLEMERSEQPHDPFTLFNLGATYAELGRHDEALPLLQESLDHSHPRDSIVRKLYSLKAGCHLNRRRLPEALQACLQGQTVCPDDQELLFLEGAIRTDQGDYHGAKAALVRLLGTESEQHFASVADGLRGHKGRHQLAVVCCRLGEATEAELLWQSVLRDRPDFLPAHLGMGELYLSLKRWPELEDQALALAKMPHGELEAVLLRAKAHMARQEYTTARSLLTESLQRWPDALALWMTLSHALLQEDRDHAEAERVLREILLREPGNANARQNLEVLRRRTGRSCF